MIEGAVQQQLREPVLRLVALQAEPISAVLLKRGIDPASLDAALDAIASVDIPFNVEQAVAYSFVPREDQDLPYSEGRFGNGQYPVFYGALHEATCVAELRHHVRHGLQQLQTGTLAFPRYYQLIVCDFSGNAMMLVGFVRQYPDLISKTEEGYPFCRKIARWAIDQGADALHTSSARHHDGTCVPVFTQVCLGNPHSRGRYRFAVPSAGDVVAEKLDAS